MGDEEVRGHGIARARDEGRGSTGLILPSGGEDPEETGPEMEGYPEAKCETSLTLHRAEEAPRRTTVRKLPDLNIRLYSRQSLPDPVRIDNPPVAMLRLYSQPFHHTDQGGSLGLRDIDIFPQDALPSSRSRRTSLPRPHGP